MKHEPEDQAQGGIGAAVMALQRLAAETIEAARQGQVVETDLLTMRIGIMAEALRHSDRAVALAWRPQLAQLVERLNEFGEILGLQESKLKAEMAARGPSASVDAYR